LRSNPARPLEAGNEKKTPKMSNSDSMGDGPPSKKPRVGDEGKTKSHRKKVEKLDKKVENINNNVHN